ncbi:MAG: pentapeptide repeat-containing protein, partial [Thiotrichaceae bacterium]|nr:pentapeptide repeat-containing protein [Thiotrichaceae bacterium]
MSYFFTTRLEIILQKISLMSQFFKEKFRLIVLLSFIFIFIVIITSYQLLVVYPLSKSEVNLDQLRALQKFEEIMDKKLKSYLKIRQWFLPRITLYSEILVPINKEELEVLQEIKAGKKDQPLLLSVTMQNKKNRNFRLTRLEQCILPNISFRKSQFQGAYLDSAQLQGA